MGLSTEIITDNFAYVRLPNRKLRFFLYYWKLITRHQFFFAWSRGHQLSCCYIFLFLLFCFWIEFCVIFINKMMTLLMGKTFIIIIFIVFYDRVSSVKCFMFQNYCFFFFIANSHSEIMRPWFYYRNRHTTLRICCYCCNAISFYRWLLDDNSKNVSMHKITSIFKWDFLIFSNSLDICWN